MNEYIYYPGFEVRDPNWLNFALLYLNKLDPIIPFTGDRYLSDVWRRLLDESDLLDIHRPGYAEGEIATLDAIDQMEKVLAHPDRYARILGDSNIIDTWTNPLNQTWTLLEEKYSHVWDEFCVREHIAHHCADGLRVPKEVCLIYMTILAQCIADSTGVPCITDHPQLDRFAAFARQATAPGEDIVDSARNIIQLQIPRNLGEIGMEELVKLRSRDGFKDKQRAFHAELSKFLNDIEEGKEVEDFSGSLGSTWSDFRADILSVGAGVASFSMGVLMFLQSDAGWPGVVDKIIGGIGMTFGSIHTFKKTWQHTKNTRLARRYLADLDSLQ